MNEFSLISRYFAPLTAGDEGALNLQDDAALISPTSGNQLVITADAMTENVHFFAGDNPYSLARKLLRVNLSDLASMGAEALYYLLTCVLPKNTPKQWIERFTQGLADDNIAFNVHLLGGDTVSQHGPLTLSLTAIGQLPSGQALTRAGAKAGDDIYVSGTIGDAALALHLLKGSHTHPSVETKAALLSRYYLPLPRMELGKGLRSLAHSAMDISDGLLQDAGHIARNSAVQLVIESEKIPLSPAARDMLSTNSDLFASVVTGGDDYELLFTASPMHREALLALSATTNTTITRIGRVLEGKDVCILDKQGEEMLFDSKGYQHF